MFSVVIPLYNKEVSIRNTISSVLSQTFGDFEIIVVNDGSTDNSLNVVETINDPRIKIVDKSNGGVSSARNKGIEEATNEWIAFLDGDDLWKKNHLEIMKQLIDKFPSDVAFCTSFVKSSDQKNLQEMAKIDSYEIIEDYFVEAIKRHFFWTSVVVIKRLVFKEIGLFNQGLVFGEDLDLWSRLGKKYRIVRSKSVTGIYNLEAENRACLNTYDYPRSFVSTINLSGKFGNEKKYLKHLLYRRLYISLKNRDFLMALKILKQFV